LSFIGTEQERTLWYVPVEDGSPDRIGSFACRLVRRSPDNHWIACVSGTAVILADRDGHRIRQLAAFPFPLENLGWTPDGRALRVSLLNTSSRDYWEIPLSSQGNTLAPSTPVRLELGENCCSSWGWFDDGRQFAYMKPGADGEQSLFVRPAHSSWMDWARSESEIPVKIGALQEVASMKDGTTLYLLIQGAWRGQLLKYDVSKKGFTTFLPGLTAGYLSFSPDGQWITYIDDHQALWRSRSDGTQALKISGDIQPVQLSSWSPDGKKIAFIGLKPGRPWRIFIVGRDGGEPVEAVTGDDNQGTPTWSPDGRKLAYGNVLCNDTQSCWIRILDLQTGAVEKLPESHGFRTARWSPDGRWIAALVPETHQLMLFDVNHKRWRPLADAVTGDTVNWSRNSRFVYADSSLAERPIIERFRVLDGRRSTAVSLEEVQKIPGQIDFWFGLDPSDTPFVVHRFNASEVYAMDWK
jgi:Tol biopolymer transport system component